MKLYKSDLAVCVLILLSSSSCFISSSSSFNMFISLFSVMRNKIRVHLNRKDFTVFIHEATDVNVRIINRIKKTYVETDSVTSSNIERF